MKNFFFNVCVDVIVAQWPFLLGFFVCLPALMVLVAVADCGRNGSYNGSDFLFFLILLVVVEGVWEPIVLMQCFTFVIRPLFV